MSKENSFFLIRVGKIDNHKVAVPMGNQCSKEVFSQLSGFVQDIYEDGLVGIVVDYTGQVFIYPKNQKKGGELRVSSNGDR